MRYPQRYLITAALPYANGPLHIGHLAGAYLSADIYVRYLRMMGKDVAFICGSDEHGAAITMRARKEETSPQEIIDKYDALFRKTFRGMGIDFDYFDRTSTKEHHQTAQDFFRKLHQEGVLEEEESEQYFDPQEQQFLADRYIIGTCPKCGYEEAYGDQCESCGTSLSPKELVNPRSTLSGVEPILKSTRHWYLPLDRDEDWLREWLEEGTLEGEESHDPKSWKPHVLGQCKSWIDNGLQSRAMTRDLDWGVDVPSEIPGAEGKKLYVWMDAPIGYISATKKWAAKNDKNWKDYWQTQDSALIHFIGKDNIVFHCIIFPALLKAHGNYVLPMNVPANQFMNLEGRKISTSRNWAVWVHEFLEDMPGREDEMRYVLTRIMPEHRDSEFTWKGFRDMNNNELVNALGNFIQRVLVLTNKYYEGKVPAFDEDCEINGAEEPDTTSYHDAEMIDLFDLLHAYGDAMRGCQFRTALQTAMEIADRGNQLLQFNEPWKKIKDDPDSVRVVMNLSLQVVSALSLALTPFMPKVMGRLRELLELEPVSDGGELLEAMNAIAEGEHLLNPDHAIQKPEHLFTRVPDEEIDQQLEKLKNNAPEKDNAPDQDSESDLAPLKEEMDFPDFAKMDLRVARIIKAQKVPKTDKLLEISLDLGFEERTVVSGIAQFFQPDEIAGKSVVVVANLAPKKLRGVLSQGMILMAEEPDGHLHFVSPPEAARPGSIVK